MNLETKGDNFAEVMTEINETVPRETKTIMAEIGRLDELASKQSDKVQALKVNFVANFELLSVEQRKTACDLMETEMRVILDLSNQKLVLVNEMEEMLKKARKNFENAAKKFDRPKPEGVPQDEEGFRSPTTSGKREKKSKKDEGDSSNATYCWCRLEKTDEMIFCENPGCPHQWYHFTCIGMVTAPLGDFYCSTACREAVKKSAGKLKSKKKH